MPGRRSTASARVSDFSAVHGLWRSNVPARLFGPRATRFESHLGIRADEAQRLAKRAPWSRAPGCEARIARAQGQKGRAWGDQPPGELVKAPLIEAGIDREAVTEFWQAPAPSRDFDLDLPPDGRYGNCVFCMMKGRIGLTALARECPSDPSNPESIDWWASMEAQYGRDLIAERRPRTQKNVTHFGFFRQTAHAPMRRLLRPPVQRRIQDFLNPLIAVTPRLPAARPSDKPARRSGQTGRATCLPFAGLSDDARRSRRPTGPPHNPARCRHEHTVPNSRSRLRQWYTRSF